MLERRKEILEIVQAQEKVSVRELAEHFQCSEVTIRTDLRDLEQNELLERTHGGAVRLQKVVPNYRPENLYRNVTAKQQIAACAFQIIRDRDTIILDDSTSAFYLAAEIRRHPEKMVAVVTNSLLIGSELANLSHVELYVVGGIIGGHMPASFGKNAIDDIKRFIVDKAFISVHSINFDIGLTSIGDLQMQFKQAILTTTSDITVLADSSRFGSGFITVICPLSKVTRIITDNQVTMENRKKAAKNNVPLIIA